MADPVTCARCRQPAEASPTIGGMPYCRRCRRALASDRGLAFCFEVILPLVLLNAGFWRLDLAGGTSVDNALLGIVLVVAYVAWLAYFLLKDGLRGGRSVGKQWRGIEVRALEGGPCSRWQSFVRNVILVIPFVVWVEILCVLWRADGRRIGDLLAKTVVVAKAPTWS